MDVTETIIDNVDNMNQQKIRYQDVKDLIWKMIEFSPFARARMFQIHTHQWYNDESYDSQQLEAKMQQLYQISVTTTKNSAKADKNIGAASQFNANTRIALSNDMTLQPTFVFYYITVSIFFSFGNLSCSTNNTMYKTYNNTYVY